MVAQEEPKRRAVRHAGGRFMRVTFGLSRIIWLLAVAIFLCSSTAYAEDLTVMVSGGFGAAYSQLLPQFERETRNRVLTITAGSSGSPDAIPSRLQRGEAADVIILTDFALAELVAQGRVVAGSSIRLGQS